MVEASALQEERMLGGLWMKEGGAQGGVERVMTRGGNEEGPKRGNGGKGVKGVKGVKGGKGGKGLLELRLEMRKRHKVTIQERCLDA